MTQLVEIMVKKSRLISAPMHLSEAQKTCRRIATYLQLCSAPNAKRYVLPTLNKSSIGRSDEKHAPQSDFCFQNFGTLPRKIQKKLAQNQKVILNLL